MTALRPPSTESDPDDDREVGDDSTWPADDSKAEAIVEALRPGDSVGRFRVDRLLGAGGMGRVYAAHDPELERTVAVKVLRTTGWAGSRDRARFVREARAMAKLRHPNVVSIHDAGEDHGQPYIAMELVDGPTLGRWIVLEDRAWRDIRDAFVAAGRGLAAAHDAGIVHRDFKLSNVMCRSTGGVVVLDFGLALAAGDDALELAKGTRDSDDVTLTRTGAILGTLPYMAPELLGGHARATAKSDQWSFCVALYEALYGEVPFSGGSAVEIAAAIGAGLEAPAGPPRFLVRVMRRGLSRSPDDRYPSMHALLDDLIRDPGRRARRIGVATVALAGIATALAVAWPRAHAPCGDFASRLSGVWDASTRLALQSAFLASGSPVAGDAFSRVAAKLDEHADGWVVGRTDACEATRVRGEQSDELLDRRVHCLDGLRDEMAALVDRLTRGVDATMLDRSVVSASRLGDVADCADVRALSEGPPRPADPELRRSINELSRKLEDASIRGGLGEVEAATHEVDVLMHAVEAVPYLPLQARARFIHGRLLATFGKRTDAVPELDRAIHLAEDAGNTHLAASTWIVLLQTLADQDRYDDISRYMLAAESAVRLVGSPRNLVGELAYARSALSRHADRPDEAIAHLRDALAHFDAPDQGLARCRVYAALGGIAAAREDLPGLVDSSTHLLAETERSVGPNHEMTADAHQHLGVAFMYKGDHERSEHELMTSIAIYRRVFGPDAPGAATSLMIASVDRQHAGKLDQALAAADESIAIYERTGPPSLKLANAIEQRGNLQQSLGHRDEARTTFERALELRRELRGDDSPNLATSYGNLGGLLLLDDKPERALAMFDKALALLDKHHMTGPRLGTAYLDVAEAQVALSRADAALANLDRAAPHVRAGDDTLVTRMRSIRASALWAAHRHAEAIAEARTAKTECASNHGIDPALCSDIAAWLARH